MVGALLGVTAAINLVAGRWPRFALYSVFWWGAFQPVMTLAPMRYPSWWGPYADRLSDGVRARRAFANE